MQTNNIVNVLIIATFLLMPLRGYSGGDPTAYIQASLSVAQMFGPQSGNSRLEVALANHEKLIAVIGKLNKQEARMLELMEMVTEQERKMYQVALTAQELEYTNRIVGRGKRFTKTIVPTLISLMRDPTLSESKRAEAIQVYKDAIENTFPLFEEAVDILMQREDFNALAVAIAAYIEVSMRAAIEDHHSLKWVIAMYQDYFRRVINSKKTNSVNALLANMIKLKKEVFLEILKSSNEQKFQEATKEFAANDTLNSINSVVDSNIVDISYSTCSTYKTVTHHPEVWGWVEEMGLDRGFGPSMRSRSYVRTKQAYTTEQVQGAKTMSYRIKLANQKGLHYKFYQVEKKEENKGGPSCSVNFDNYASFKNEFTIKRVYLEKKVKKLNKITQLIESLNHLIGTVKTTIQWLDMAQENRGDLDLWTLLGPTISIIDANQNQVHIGKLISDIEVFDRLSSINEMRVLDYRQRLELRESIRRQEEKIKEALEKDQEAAKYQNDIGKIRLFIMLKTLADQHFQPTKQLDSQLNEAVKNELAASIEDIPHAIVKTPKQGTEKEGAQSPLAVRKRAKSLDPRTQKVNEAIRIINWLESNPIDKKQKISPTSPITLYEGMILRLQTLADDVYNRGPTEAETIYQDNQFSLDDILEIGQSISDISKIKTRIELATKAMTSNSTVGDGELGTQDWALRLYKQSKAYEDMAWEHRMGKSRIDALTEKVEPNDYLKDDRMNNKTPVIRNNH